MNKDIEQLLQKAKSAIQSNGWYISESDPDDRGRIHLFIVKDNQRKGWGMFSPLDCWIFAYEAVTGNQWIELIERT